MLQCTHVYVYIIINIMHCFDNTILIQITYHRSTCTCVLVLVYTHTHTLTIAQTHTHMHPYVHCSTYIHIQPVYM